MNNITSKLTEWAVNKIKTDYPDDVALLIAVEGHSVNGDGHGECFDYFIPSTEKGNELSQTFIIDGIGYDLYSRSWERTERTSNLDDGATICLSNAKILYSRNKEDEERFFAIQRRLYDNLGNARFTYQKALENLNIAMDIYRTMMFEDKMYKVRMGAGFINYYLSLTVAYLNGTFFKDWRYGQLPELLRMKELPDNFIKYFEAIISAQSQNKLKDLAHSIIYTTRQFISTHKPVTAIEENIPQFSNLADWYQELCLFWLRLRYYCEIKNCDAAFSEACNIQNELNIVKEEFGLNEMDLLGYFDATNLTAISEQAIELEKYIVSEIENHNVKIKQFNTLDEFLAQK